MFKEGQQSRQLEHKGGTQRREQQRATPGVTPATEHLRSLTSLTSTNPQYRAPYDTGVLVNSKKGEEEIRQMIQAEVNRIAQEKYSKSYDQLSNKEKNKVRAEQAEQTTAELEKELGRLRKQGSIYDDEESFAEFLGKKPHQQAKDKPWDTTEKKDMPKREKQEKEEKPAQSGKDYFFNPFTGEMEEK